MAIKVRIVDPPTIQLKSSAGTVKQVDSGNGLTGGPITSTGTISVNANTGLIANSSGLFLANSVLFPNTINGNTAQDLRDYSDSVGEIAYSNAVTIANGYASSAYSNAVTIANGYVSTAYSNAIIVANNLASNAYSNAVTIANGYASSAYSNAVTVANNLASNAYSNAVTIANGYASSAYSNAILVANDYASSAYSNAILVANTLASSAYSNAILVANTLASSAYSNAIAFASNASNINTGTLSSSLLPVSGVVANVYGSASQIPILTVDNTGRVTNVSLANADAIDSFTYSSNTNTLSLLASDGATFNVAINSVNNFIVTGNLTVNGTLTHIQSNTVLFDDNILIINKGLRNDPSDIGIIGYYIDSQTLSWGSETISWGSNTAAWGAQNSYSGVFRDATDGIWKIFQSYTPNPDSSFEIDTSNSSFTLAPLQISTLYANSISANGSIGTNGQVLHSDGTNIYWATDDVNYPAGSNTEIQFNDSGNFGANSGLTFDSGLGRLNVGNVGITSQTVFFGNSGLSFSNGSSNAVFLSANGNVGIGTDNPSSFLQVGQNVTGGDNWRFDKDGHYLAQSWGPTERWKLQSKGYNYDHTSLDFIGGGQLFTNSTTNIGLAFNGTPRLTVISGGNVGIGTTSPAEKLDVAGNIVTKNNTTPTSIGVYGTYTDSLNYERLSLSSNSTASYIQTENVGTGTARPLRLGANNSTAVTIATNGNVGIGTTSPLHMLDVAGGVRATYQTTSAVHGWGNTLLDLVGVNGSNPGTNDGRFHIGYNQNDSTVRLNSSSVQVYSGIWYFQPKTWFLGGVTSTHNTPFTLDGMTNGVTAGTATDIVRFTQRDGMFAKFYDAGTGFNEFQIWQQADTNKYIYLRPGRDSVFKGGNVGIDTTSPAEKLDVSGNIQSSNTVFAVHFDNVSDISLKENISSLNNTIDTLNKLNPVSFDWKNSKTKSYGLIAQEVEQILPTIVHSKQDGTKTVNYIEIIAFLIAAVKDLQRQIDDINSK